METNYTIFAFHKSQDNLVPVGFDSLTAWNKVVGNSA